MLKASNHILANKNQDRSRAKSMGSHLFVSNTIRNGRAGYVDRLKGCVSSNNRLID